MYNNIKNKILKSMKEVNKGYIIISFITLVLTRYFCFGNPKLIILVVLIMEHVRLTLDNTEDFKYKRLFYGFIFFIIFPLLKNISQNFLFGLFISVYTSQCINLLKKYNII